MAINYVNNLKSNVTTSTTLYNPTTASVQCTVIGLLIANTSSSTVTATVTLTSGATTANIVKNITIPVGNSLDVVQAAKIVIEQNDVVSISASGTVDAILSAIEVS